MARPRFVPGSNLVFPVKNRSGKKTLASYLAARLGVVEAWAQILIDNGQVKLDQSVALPTQIINLSAGPHCIEVHFPENWPPHMAPEPMQLDLLHEDQHLVVLNKPPGIVVHPARGHLDGITLQNGLRHRYRQRLGLPDVTIGSPHRLDKDTSGVIVFALTTPVYVSLVEQFANALPQKEYLAVLVGIPDFHNCVCEKPLGNDPNRRGLGAVIPTEKGGKYARTDFTVLERGNGWALARAVPKTGRPHQIRIHAASMGLPVAGDRDYNPAPERFAFPRQALHAAALTFNHPVAGQALRVESPLPEDLAAALGKLR